MKKTSALWIVFFISVAGMLFSGYLSYSELFRGSCSLGGCSFKLGLPVCVYGFFMYLAVFVISWIGISAKN